MGEGACGKEESMLNDQDDAYHVNSFVSLHIQYPTPLLRRLLVSAASVPVALGPMQNSDL
jgi:hypothetical protein